MVKKFGLKIAASILDWLCFALSILLICLLAYLAQIMSSSGTGTVTTDTSLDTIVPVVLQIAIFLFLGIASLSRKKGFMIVTLVFAFTTNTALSFMSDFQSLFSLPATFASSWETGHYSLGQTVGDLVLAAATIFFWASVLQEDGKKTPRSLSYSSCVPFRFIVYRLLWFWSLYLVLIQPAISSASS